MIGTATLFTNYVFRPYMNKGEKNDTKEIWISRAVMVLAGCVGLAVALSGSNIISIMMSAFALRSAGPFAAFICGKDYGGYSLGLNAPVKDAEDAWFGHGGAWGTNCSVN